MHTRFKLADVVRITGWSEHQIDYWRRLGLAVPVEGGDSRGSHCEYSALGVIEIALAGELMEVAGLSATKVAHVFALHRRALAKVPRKYRAVELWKRYVASVKAIADTLGQSNDPKHRRWLVDVARVSERLRRHASRTEQESCLFAFVERQRTGAAAVER